MNYIEKYSDYPTLDRLRSEIEISDNPPVCFYVNGKFSDSMKWSKNRGETEYKIDFPSDMPSKRGIFTITYQTESLRVDIEYTFYEDYPIFEYVCKIFNVSEQNSPVISDITAIDRVISDGTATVHYNMGARVTAEDFHPYEKRVETGGELVIMSASGKPTAEWLQFFNTASDDGGIITAISWQGCWKASFTNNGKGVRMTAGQLKTEFVLLPGEYYRSPRIVFLTYKGGFIYGQNLWRRWLYNCNIMRVQEVRMTKNLLVCIGDAYPGMLGNAVDDIREIKELRDNGLSEMVDHFTQDAGWYDVKPGDNWAYVGNWYPDPDRYPHGMKEVSDEIHKSGMKYCVWFEPERIISGTKGARELGDKIIPPDANLIGNIPDGVTCLVNYANDKAVDYMIETVDRIITEQDIDTYRQDFNVNPAPYWVIYDKYISEKMGIPRFGLTEEKYCRGYLRLWETLIGRHPGLIIDSCASGGMRNDLDTIRMSFPHSRSDMWWNTVGAQNQSYGMCMWYVLMGGGCNDINNEYERRSRFVTSFGSIIKVITPRSLRYYGEWEDMAAVMKGDFYPLTEYDNADSGVMAFQFNNDKSESGMIAAYVRNVTDGGKVTLYPRELNAEKIYTLTLNWEESGAVKIPGDALVKNGITIDAALSNTAYIYKYI